MNYRASTSGGSSSQPDIISSPSSIDSDIQTVDRKELLSSSLSLVSDGTLSTKTLNTDDSRRLSGDSDFDGCPMEVLHESISNKTGDDSPSASCCSPPSIAKKGSIQVPFCDDSPRFSSSIDQQRLDKTILARIVANEVINTIEKDTSGPSTFLSRNPTNKNTLSESSDFSLPIGIKAPESSPPPSTCLRRERSRDVDAAPPSKPKRRPSDEGIADMLSLELLPLPPQRMEKNRQQKNRTTSYSSHHPQKKIDKKIPSNEDYIDVSNHSAPPNCSSSSLKRSITSGTTRSPSLSPEQSRDNDNSTTGSLRRIVGEISCSRDSRPKQPIRRQRRYSDEFSLGPVGEEEYLHGPSPSLQPQHQSKINSPTKVRAEDMEAYVMARIPNQVKKKLPPSTWSHIFSVVAETAVSSASGSSKSSGSSSNTKSSSKIVVEDLPETDDADNDGAASVISGVTLPSEIQTIISNELGLCPNSSFTGDIGPRFSEKSPMDTKKGMPSSGTTAARANLDNANDTSPTSETLSMTSRSWGSSAMVESAPRLPQRLSRSQPPSIPRRSSAPITRSYSDLLPPPNGGFGSRNRNERFTSSSSKKVSFDKVHIREYERILEINPCTSSGPAVGIGWRHSETESVAIDEVQLRRRHSSDSLSSYEASSGGGDSLILSRRIREKMLTDLGYSQREIADAVRQSLRTKNQRKQTYNNLSAEKVEYLVEKSRRKVGQLLRFRSSSNISNNKSSSFMEDFS